MLTFIPSGSFATLAVPFPGGAAGRDVILARHVPQDEVDGAVAQVDGLLVDLYAHRGEIGFGEHARDIPLDQAGLADREAAEHVANSTARQVDIHSGRCGDLAHFICQSNSKHRLADNTRQAGVDDRRRPTRLADE